MTRTVTRGTTLGKLLTRRPQVLLGSFVLLFVGMVGAVIALDDGRFWPQLAAVVAANVVVQLVVAAVVAVRRLARRSSSRCPFAARGAGCRLGSRSRRAASSLPVGVCAPRSARIAMLASAPCDCVLPLRPVS